MKIASKNLPAVYLHLLCVALFLLPSSFAKAELRRIEATGEYRLRDAMRSKVIALDEAVALARWEGVSGVAFDLIRKAAPQEPETSTPQQPESIASDPAGEHLYVADTGEPEGDTQEPSAELNAAMRKALGHNLLPYMRRYRILDDRGEVPVLIEDQSELRIDYVVVVEVVVDVDRVQSALEAAGLIAAQASTEGAALIAVEVVGLMRFEALEVLRVGLREQFGATEIQTVEYARGRQLLLVEGPFEPKALSAMLTRWQSPQLFLEPIGVDSIGRRIRLMGRWFPKSGPVPGENSDAAPELF